MRELKFLQILNQLSRSYRSRLTDFFVSPYCNKDPHLIRFLHAVLASNESNPMEIDKYAIWDQVFEGANFNDSKWRQLSHDFIKAVHQFLIFESVKQNKFKSNNLLLTLLAREEFTSIYNSSISSAEKDFEKFNSLSSEFFYEKFDFEKNIYEIKNYEVNMEVESNIRRIHENLDLFYLTEKLKQLVNIVTRRNFLNTNLDIPLEKEVIDIINAYNLLEHPGIEIYYKFYRLKSSDSEHDYYELKNKIYERIHLFFLEDAVDVLKEIINYCSLKINLGKIGYAEDALNFYKFGLKNNYIFPNNKFNPGDFLNIVIYGIRTKEFTWTENFIEEYQKIIPTNQRKTLVTFSLARLYFNQSKYDEVIEKLRDVEFDEITYNLDSKVLLLATYYEVNESQAMMSLADSFRTFLTRHEKDITADKKQRYTNFIKFIKKLSRAKYQDKKAKQKLLEEINKTPGVVNQGWLVSKAKSL